MLQVLLSLQGLVLIADPYYNEAGYEVQRGTDEGKHNSRLYSENALLISLETSVLHIIKHPPRHFESLVVSHFKMSAGQIMSQIKKLLKGEPSSYFSTNSLLSSGFVATVRRVAPRVLDALAAYQSAAS